MGLLRRTPPTPKRRPVPAEVTELREKRARIVGHATALPTPGTPDRVIAERLDRQIEEAIARHEQTET